MPLNLIHFIIPKMIKILVKYYICFENIEINLYK